MLDAHAARVSIIDVATALRAAADNTVDAFAGSLGQAVQNAALGHDVASQAVLEEHIALLGSIEVGMGACEDKLLKDAVGCSRKFLEREYGK